MQDAKKEKLNREALSKLVLKSSLEKIKRDDYGGLNLTELKITLLGEVDIAEQNIQLARESKFNSEAINNLIKKANEMKMLQEKVNRALEQSKVSTDKCGARLKAKDELQEWLEKQEDLRRNPEQDGSNIFTYRHQRGRIRQAEMEFEANSSLINDVQLMQMK